MATKDENTVAAAFVALLVWPFGVLYSGVAFRFLWAWFVVPIAGVRPITLIEAISIGLVVSYLTNHVDMRIEDRRDAWTRLGHSITMWALRPTFALTIGWVLHNLTR